jgi:peptide/nickel transport system substrate-binding protein
MKKLLTLVMASLLTGASFAAEKGGEPDTIYFNVKMQDEVGVKDVAEGLSDIYLKSIKASVYNGLDQATKDKLEVYSVPSGSWSLFVNPVPNKAPYHVEKNGVTEFNPFAIKEVRYAMNFLINRKKVVDEILDGAGGVKYTQATPGQPNAWRIDLVADKFGFTPEGDQEKAIADITAALEKAAKLPDNKGRLVKKSDFWYFDGKPVTIRFVIRVDDPNGRLKLGNYTSDLLEKAGIKVEKLLWDFKKAANVVYYSDPGNADWTLYTEAWGGGSTYVWWQVPTQQYMTEGWGYLPGGGTEGWWNFHYADPKMKELAEKTAEYRWETLEDRWAGFQEMTKFGLEDSLRVFVTYQNDYFVANKDRFKERMFYGLGTGLDRFALENAKVEDGILTVTQYSAAGGTFGSPWDPIGANGMSDSYTQNIVQLIFDREIVDGPMGRYWRRRADLTNNVSKPVFNEDGTMTGEINVDPKAIKYNPYTNKFEKVGSGHKAALASSYKVDMGKWHHGRKITVADYLYASAFTYEWATKESDKDLRYDKPYGDYWEPNLKMEKGTVYGKDNTVTTYADKYDPAGGLYNIANPPTLQVQGAQHPDLAVPFEILEAIDSLVVDGSASGTKYGLTEREGVEPIDLKNPRFTTDILAKLKDFVAERHIPTVLKGRLSDEEIIDGYKETIKFIEDKGHALIGYGAYYLNRLDAKSGFAELKAFRDSDYTEEKGKWSKLLKTNYLRIESVETPDIVIAGEDATFELSASNIEYPADTAIRAQTGKVSAILVLEDGSTKEFEGSFNGNGQFEVTIPADETMELSGVYTVVLTATLDGNFTDTESVKIEVY